MKKTWWQSNQAFGVVFSVFFMLLCARKYFKFHIFSLPLFSTAIVFLIFTLIAPEKLASLNKAWMKLGELLAKISTPIVIGILFFGAFTGISILLKLFRAKLMPLAADPSVKSYWITRSDQEQIKKNLPLQF